MMLCFLSVNNLDVKNEIEIKALRLALKTNEVLKCQLLLYFAKSTLSYRQSLEQVPQMPQAPNVSIIEEFITIHIAFNKYNVLLEFIPLKVVYSQAQ